VLLWQVLLSTEDLNRMIDEVSGNQIGGFESNTSGSVGTVNLRTFLLIMEHSSW
jgi:hypothetical protein